jgi:hypothetical protein
MGRRAGLVLPLMLLAACASARFGPTAGGPPGPSRVASAPPLDAEPLPPTTSSPSVIASPLPPVPGTGPAPEPLPGEPSAPGNIATLGPPSGVQTLGTPASPAAPPASRSSATGNWTAREASGGACRMTLSSSPSLDLYKASSSGCANKDLQSVNAWEFRDGEIYLYARGGVVARLRDSGGSFNGALAKSGAPVSLTR